MEFLRKTVRVGNSAGVILPKKILGSEVKVIVVKRFKNLKKEIIKLLEKDFEDIIGIYITNKNPFEVLAFSSNIKKVIKNEKLKINISPITTIQKDLRNVKSLRTKIMNAEPIFNKHLLAELKKKIKKNNTPNVH